MAYVSLSSWLKRFFIGRPQASPGGSRRRSRQLTRRALAFEQLEQRDCPTAGIAITSVDHASFTIASAGNFLVQTAGATGSTTISEQGVLPANVSFIDNHDGTASLAGIPNTGTDKVYTLTIDAHDNGSGTDAPQTFNLTVLKQSLTTLSVTPSTGQLFSRPVTLQASVTPAVGTTTLAGTISFFDGTTEIGAPVTMIAGKATLTTTALSAGSHALTAVYSGIGAYGPSTSHVVTESINATSTQVLLTPSTLAPTYGQPVTFTAHVNSLTPGTGAPAGTITFMDGSTPLASPVTLVNGVATLPNETLAVGPHSLKAVFASTNTNQASANSSVLTETVTAAHAVVTVSSSPGSLVYGQQVTLTANVSVLAPASNSNITGSVTFKDGSTTLATVPVLNGVATFSTSALSSGTRLIYATYGGDSKTTGTYGVARVVVNRTATTLGLTTPSISLAAQTVTLSAQVNVATPGVLAPTGTVGFYRGGALLGTGTIDSSGAATFTTQKLTAGDYTFTAVYRGDANYVTSTMTGTTTVVTVGHGTTTVAVVSSSAPGHTSASGSTVSFTATVMAGSPAGTPTGTVSFYDGTLFIGSATLSSGSATLSSVKLASGTHSITAKYSGDVNYAANTSAAWSQTVQVATTTSLSLSTLAPVYGQNVTLTARVNPTSYSPITPTGTITFMDGTTQLGLPVNLVNGSASLPNQALAVGSHALTAVFTSSNANQAGSTSIVYNETVVLARTAVAFSAAPSPAVVGQSVTLTANVSVMAPGSAAPGGIVTFKDGLTTLGTGTVTSGVATFMTTSLAAGTHTFTISYGGDANTAGSSTIGKLVVNAATTTVNLSSSPQFSLAGHPVTLTAHVAVVGPGVATPSGTVAFYNGSALLGTGTVSNGVATFTTQNLAAGTDHFTAVYRGDSRCQSSTSAAWSVQMVNPPVITALSLASAHVGDPGGTISWAAGKLVVANVTGTDPQGLTITYTYQWLVNGTVVHTDTMQPATDQFDLSTVPAAGPGGTVTVIVTPNNGIDGSAVTSSSLSITA